MRRSLALLLFEDDNKEGARAKRTSPVEKAEAADRAKDKASLKITPDGFPVHSMQALLTDLATLILNGVTLPASPDHVFTMAAEPTRLQERASELLEVDPSRNVAV